MFPLRKVSKTSKSFIGHLSLIRIFVIKPHHTLGVMKGNWSRMCFHVIEGT